MDVGTDTVAPDHEIGTLPVAAIPEAIGVLQAEGIEAVALGNINVGERSRAAGEGWLERAAIAVPPEQAEAAIEALRAWVRKGDEAVKRHARNLPLDVIRILGVLALAAFVPILFGDGWRRYPIAFTVASAFLLLGLVAEWLRWQKKRRARSAHRPWFDEKRGRTRHR